MIVYLMQACVIKCSFFLMNVVFLAPFIMLSKHLADSSKSFSENLKFKIFLGGGGGHAPRPPLDGLWVQPTATNLIAALLDISSVPPPL